MIPVLHELALGLIILGDLITGNLERPLLRLDTYSKESVLGSGCMALHYAVKADPEQFKEYCKGTGRAVAQAITGGGILSDIPGFQELAIAGKSLGDCVVGDCQLAKCRWTKEYAENSCLGSTALAVFNDCVGNYERAKELRSKSLKAWGKFAISATALATCALAYGVAPHLGAAAALTAKFAVKASTSAASTFAVDKLEGKKTSPGDYLGGSLF